MLPGRIRLCPASPCDSWASATVGTPWAFVHCTRSCRLCARLTRPVVTMAPAATRAMMPASSSRRGLGVARGKDIRALPSGWGWMSVPWRRLGGLAVTRMDEAEHRRHQEQRRAGGEEQAADHRAAERRILAGLD